VVYIGVSAGQPLDLLNHARILFGMKGGRKAGDLINSMDWSGWAGRQNGLEGRGAGRSASASSGGTQEIARYDQEIARYDGRRKAQPQLFLKPRCGRSVKALRILRVFRVIRVFGRIGQLREIVGAIGRSIVPAAQALVRLCDVNFSLTTKKPRKVRNQAFTQKTIMLACCW
jgi:hypothetical protein